jgi:hypothetical protein
MYDNMKREYLAMSWGQKMGKGREKDDVFFNQ